MSTNISLEDIKSVAATARLEGFSDKFRPLGGGEVNDTFALDCGTTEVVLRVCRYSDVNNLSQEARALKLLNLDQAPKLIYFNESERLKDRAWIIESNIEGNHVNSLSIKQFECLGKLLADIHKVHSEKSISLNFWENFLDANKYFGNEQTLINYPDPKLRELINKCRVYFQAQSLSLVTTSLVHGDITLSNMLVNRDLVSLIDWEFSKFKDPMADFSTMFYEDMEYNRGKWRIHIKNDEKTALFNGYTEAGGAIDEKRLKVWITLDKLGAAIYLYWKMNQSGHDIQAENMIQYLLDFNNLVRSLEQDL
jgi:aminoglycoside phosphotransferase (APT) family kinase protein